jgi:SAM-dependent methyltransferase
MAGARRHAPAADRNKEPILDVLRRVLTFAAPDPRRPASAGAASAARPHGLVLEIAAGTGRHAAHFAAALPNVQWQPTEPDADYHESIRAWTEELPNVRPPLTLDVSQRPWPVAQADAIICINMIHISPWQSTLDLMTGAGTVLTGGGVLFLYGPYKRGGLHTAPSNEAFDADLRSRNPEWGVRDMEAVVDVAARTGLMFKEAVAMPANNFSVIFEKT